MSEPLRAIYVEWRDATALPHGWHDLDEAETHELPIMRSHGWLVHEDEFRLILCLDHDVKNNAFGGAAAIPKGCVISVKTIDL